MVSRPAGTAPPSPSRQMKTVFVQSVTSEVVRIILYLAPARPLARLGLSFRLPYDVGLRKRQGLKQPKQAGSVQGLKPRQKIDRHVPSLYSHQRARTDAGPL